MVWLLVGSLDGFLDWIFGLALFGLVDRYSDRIVIRIVTFTTHGQPQHGQYGQQQQQLESKETSKLLMVLDYRAFVPYLSFSSNVNK